MKVLVWNMQSKIGNWTSVEDFGADIAILCEARNADYRLLFSRVGAAKTAGRDYERPWATAIVSPHELEEVRDAQLSRRGKPLQLPFEASRPGSWTAATVSRPGREDVTVVSLYGLMDEKSDASVHRSLSELAAIFEDKRYRDRVLLGGDLNILAAPRPDDPVRERHLLVLDRIKAYGLVDCLDQMRPSGPLEGCPCGLGDECRHTWTKFDPARPDISYQDDYLYASATLAKRLLSCKAYDPRDWAQKSDHAPIVAEFDM